MKPVVMTWAVALAATQGYCAASGSELQRPATPVVAPATGNAESQRLVVPWSDPSRPGTVRVQVISGSIEVRGYDGKEVIVDIGRTRGDGDDDEQDERGERGKNAGLRRIPNTSSRVTVEEEGNELRIDGAPTGDDETVISLQVPRRTSLKLSTINDGTLVVRDVEGEIEASNINGRVTLTNVAGAVVAHSLNDDLEVTLTRVSGKPMSFSSLNGDIDVTLPADIKANVRLETVSGEIFTDFDLSLQPGTARQSVDERKQGGRYRVKLERSMIGTINGGGPELSFKNFNGDIRIRKQK